MSRLVGTLTSGSTIASFFGSMTFLDTQNTFDGIFGKNPIILDTQPIKGTPMECLKRVCTYADKCTLDIFLVLEICRENYVGGDDAGSKRKLVHEMCKQLSLVKMNNGDTPGKMYSRYISMVAGLLDNASLWSITLCSSYFSALSNNPKDKIE